MSDKYQIFLGRDKKVKIAADDEGNFFAEASGNRIKLSDGGLDLSGNTDALKLPKGTTAQRPTPVDGMLRFNSETGEFEGHNGTEWGAIAGSGGGGGLEGTQYVFVTANGTDVENAAELQAAYNTAISQAITASELQDLGNQGINFSAYQLGDPYWEIYLYNSKTSDYFDGTGFYDMVINGVNYNIEVFDIPFEESFYITLPSEIQSIDSLALYSTSTLSSTVIAANGLYNFSSDFVMDTEYVNLVSLDGNRSIVFNGTGTLSVEADHVFVKGVDVQAKAFRVSDNLPNITIENCSGGDYSFSGESEGSTLIPSLILSGNFIKCVGGAYAFGGLAATLSGTFTDCTGGYNAFFAESGTMSGTFNNCIGENYAFIFNNGTLSGIFTDCKGSHSAFNGNNGTMSGTFINCTGNNYSFSGNNGTLSGTFTDCTGKYYSFGYGGTASGTFNNCIGGVSSFGGNNGTILGTSSGTFNNCIGGLNSFAGNGGTLSGKLYYCRLTSGTFDTVTGSGRTVYCIDGNNNTNNQ